MWKSCLTAWLLFECWDYVFQSTRPETVQTGERSVASLCRAMILLCPDFTAQALPIPLHSNEEPSSCISNEPPGGMMRRDTMTWCSGRKDEKRKFQNVSTNLSWICEPNLVQLYGIMIHASVQDGKLNQTQTSLRQHQVTIASPYNTLFTLTLVVALLASSLVAPQSRPCPRTLALVLWRWHSWGSIWERDKWKLSLESLDPLLTIDTKKWASSLVETSIPLVPSHAKQKHLSKTKKQKKHYYYRYLMWYNYI